MTVRVVAGRVVLACALLFGLFIATMGLINNTMRPINEEVEQFEGMMIRLYFVPSEARERLAFQEARKEFRRLFIVPPEGAEYHARELKGDEEVCRLNSNCRWPWRH